MKDSIKNKIERFLASLGFRHLINLDTDTDGYTESTFRLRNYVLIFRIEKR